MGNKVFGDGKEERKPSGGRSYLSDNAKFSEGLSSEQRKAGEMSGFYWEFRIYPGKKMGVVRS